jgi:hypothetical protein
VAPYNGGVNLSAAGPRSLRPLMLQAVSLFVKPGKMPVRRPQVTPGALERHTATDFLRTACFLSCRSNSLACCLYLYTWYLTANEGNSLCIGRGKLGPELPRDLGVESGGSA